MTTIEQFSSGYYIIDGARAIEWGRDYSVIPKDLHYELQRYVEEPVLKIGTMHYFPETENAVPAETIVVPESSDVKTGDEVLVAKDTTARRVVGDAG